LTEIAVAGVGRTVSRVLAVGHGWSVSDVQCTAGPRDRPFDEQHDRIAIAIVTAGTFQYRGSGSGGRELMTPGSLLLGSPGQAFQCGHEHAAGDRCLSFQFTPEYFESVSAASLHGRRAFRALRLPPVRPLSRWIAQAIAALSASTRPEAWQELGIALAGQAREVDDESDLDRGTVWPSAVARVTRSVRLIEDQPDANLSVPDLAREARLSPFHFLRTFKSLVGVTPHQYQLRTRLRSAASRLARAEARIIDVSLDSGFADVSSFTRSFKAEFGQSPAAYRRRNSRRRAPFA
jgi:AraC-like DNA-binding protein